MELSEIGLLTAIFLFGGVVKGALGIGFPALLVGLLTFFYEPRAAVAMILFAIMATNFRQASVGGSMWVILKRHKYFATFACAGIFLVALIGAKVPLALLQTCVGGAMVLFAVTSLYGAIPRLTPKYTTSAQIGAGIGSGILGGLTAIWGPPLAVYLMALRLERDVMIQTLGVMFSVQSIFLMAGFIVTGELTLQIAILGSGLLVPTFVGMYFGERIRKRMDTAQFMKAFLFAFLLLGINLIRRGIMGA
ncbi:permease [Amylibacter ulvae]|uniref:Probable membrane transporter protein n=1 Tax=Paramylibacter ulvae TaxID=1651968 RepID=A0ABQ3D5G7_9RHOB|nr:sulfite exporter TauE/SafE family protein [Amylibacter ulvae]GHA59745.1 permease [Amylibacter ulvae]